MYSFLYSRLPLPDGIEWVQQHDDVEGQVVADDDADADLEEDGERHDHPYREPGRHHKTQHHEQRIAERVQDAVAVVLQRDRPFAVAVDDEFAVLDDLPQAFDAD